MKNGIRLLIICSWAFLFAQGPAFILQYMNHLSGHIQEINYQLNILKSMFEEEDLLALSIKLKESHEYYGMKQGDYIQVFIQRKAKFDASQNSLRHASIWTAPFYLLRYLDISIAEETVTDFNFGIPLTFDGGMYALFGALFGNLIWAALVRVFKKEQKVRSEEQTGS